MVPGHFGFAAGVKSQVPSAPLWALMLATQWLDVFFVPLFLLGIETITPVNPANPNAYGGGVIHAVYTHSLVGAIALSVGAGGLAWTRWGQRVGVTIGLVAFSHWLLDLIVHYPDLPILPGNAGNLPSLGFGLWGAPTAAFVELALVLVGAYLYYRAATRLPPVGTLEPAAQRRRVYTATGVVTGLMLLSFVTTILGALHDAAEGVLNVRPVWNSRSGARPGARACCPARRRHRLHSDAAAVAAAPEGRAQPGQRRANWSSALRIRSRLLSLAWWPESFRMTSSASGQACASSHAVSAGPLRSSRPWISTPGMPARRPALRSSTPSSSHAAFEK